MKKTLLLALALFVGFALTVSAAAEKQLVQFKAGNIDMTVLASDGVSPLADASIKLLSPEDASLLAEAVADHSGRAVLALDEGRYLLNVTDITLAVMDVSKDATLTSARVIVPDQSMIVAGQEAAENQQDGGASAGSSWLLPAGVVVGAAASLVPTGFIIHNNTKHGHHHHHGTSARSEETAPVKRPYHTARKTPAPSAR